MGDTHTLLPTDMETLVMLALAMETLAMLDLPMEILAILVLGIWEPEVTMARGMLMLTRRFWLPHTLATPMPVMASVTLVPLEFYKGQRDSSTSTLHHFAQIMHAWRKELLVKVFLELLVLGVTMARGMLMLTRNQDQHQDQHQNQHQDQHQHRQLPRQ